MVWGLLPIRTGSWYSPAFTWLAIHIAVTHGLPGLKKQKCLQKCSSRDDKVAELTFRLSIFFITEGFTDGQPSSSLLVYYSGVLGTSRGGGQHSKSHIPRLTWSRDLRVVRSSFQTAICPNVNMCGKYKAGNGYPIALEPLTTLKTSLHDETGHGLIGFGRSSDGLTDCFTLFLRAFRRSWAT